MNKILPIILVVVLSGCSSSPLENCADKIYKEKWGDGLKLNLSNQKFMPIYKNKYAEIMKESDECYHDADYVDTSHCARQEERRFASLADEYLSQSINEKIQTNPYRSHYKQCEDKQKRHPKTFEKQYE